MRCARKVPRPSCGFLEGRIEEFDPQAPFACACREQPRRDGQGDDRQERAIGLQIPNDGSYGESHGKSPAEPLPDTGEVRALPGKKWTDAHDDHQRQHERDERGIEIGWADRHFLANNRLCK